MRHLRLVLLALGLGVFVGARSRRRSVAAAPALPPVLDVRAQLTATEARLDHTVRSLDRDRRRTGAIAFAVAVLIVVPAALLAARPDVPDALVAGVLAADLLAAVVALLIAIKVDRSGRRERRR
ncbi:MAG: hypothetical protein WD010_07845 [Nitriliruptor sp.]|uniref:hypothetical protein n=1 Tax=Nitriliruptor sp. TaxID=2448056 RepID=UPI0034A09506